MPEKIFYSIFTIGVGLAFAPLLLGIINRTKAFFAGRKGQPLLQLYFDLWKLLHKGAVYSRTTTWIFRCGPVIGLAAMLIALALMPFAGVPSPVGFTCDFVLLIFILGIARFSTVISALDTGSSFEAMGASREVQFSAFAEPALIISLITICLQTKSLELSQMIGRIPVDSFSAITPAMSLTAFVIFVILLVENCRIPFDDPNTHLELTMIHEVMVLDHSGPDLAFILYSAALKLWILGTLLIGVVVPVRGSGLLVNLVVSVSCMFGLGILIGITESVMARFRLIRIPQMLVGAGALVILALVLVLLGLWSDEKLD